MLDGLERISRVVDEQINPQVLLIESSNGDLAAVFQLLEASQPVAHYLRNSLPRECLQSFFATIFRCSRICSQIVRLLETFVYAEAPGQTRGLMASAGKFGLIDAFEFELMELLAGRIRGHLSGRRQTYVSCLAGCLAWYACEIRPRLESLAVCEETRRKLLLFSERFLYRQFLSFSWPRLFDAIIDFPESMPLLGDLELVPREHYRLMELVGELERSLDCRLLHVAVETPDILSQLVVAIPVLRRLDPTCLALDRVAARIRCYLNMEGSRPDFGVELVKLIRMLAFDEKASESRQLRSRTKVFYDNPDLDHLAHEPDWAPDPPEAEAVPIRKSSKVGDVFAVLANLVDDEQTILLEYKRFLVDRLFRLEVGTDQMIAEIELFKSKFGGDGWQFCSVIVNDFGESSRFVDSIGSLEYLDVVVSSHIYWPRMQAEPFKWPRCIQLEMEVFHRSFSAWRPLRQACFVADPSFVELEIEFDDGVVVPFVTDADAASLIIFVAGLDSSVDSGVDSSVNSNANSNANSSAVGIDQLQNELGLDIRRLGNALNFWLKRRVIQQQETDGRFCLSRFHCSQTIVYVDDDFNAQPENPASEDSLEKYYPFIVGMLTNLGKLPLDRIHAMLGMFAPDYKGTIGQLMRLLDSKVRQDILAVTGAGLYHLK